MIRTRLEKEKNRKARETTEAWINTPITFPLVSTKDVSKEPLIVEAEVEGYLVRKSGFEMARWLRFYVSLKVSEDTGRKVTINGNFMPLKHDLSSIEEFVNEPIVNEPTVKKFVVETSKAKASADKPKVVLGKNNGAHNYLRNGCLISEEEDILLGNPQMDLQDQGVIDSGCSRHMTGKMSYLTDFEEIDGGYVALVVTQRRENPCRLFLYYPSYLGKFDGKADERFFVRVRGTNWLFDFDALTKAMNYKQLYARNQSVSPDDGFKPSGDNEKKVTEELRKEGGDSKVNAASSNTSIELPNDPNMPELEDIVYSDNYEDVGAEADMINLNIFMPGFEDHRLSDSVYNVERHFMRFASSSQSWFWVKVWDMPTIPHTQHPNHYYTFNFTPQRKQRPRKPKRKDTEIPQSSVLVENVADEAVYEERDDSGGPRRQDTMGDTIAQTRSKNVSKFSNDILVAGVNTPRSGEDSLQLKELMKFCTKLQQRVLDLENTKTAQAQEITSPIRESRIHNLDGDEVFVETEGPMVNAAITTSTILVSAAKDLSDADMTLAQALVELKSTKPKAVTTTTTTTTTIVTRPKAKGLVIQEHEQASTPITSSKDKGKGIMVEEPLKMKKKDQVLFDEQKAIRLQAQFDEEERITREKEEANAALIVQWNDIQDKVEADYELAQRLQAGNKKKLFEKAMKSVNTFVDMDTKLVGGSEVREEGSETREESSSKRAGDELEQVPFKKQKLMMIKKMKCL
ncbi:hypothetical protein Tco_0719639 [Tanacetum coccineum]